MVKRSSKKRLRKVRIEGENLYGEATTRERKQKAIQNIRNEQLFAVEKTPGQKSQLVDPTKHLLGRVQAKSTKNKHEPSTTERFLKQCLKNQDKRLLKFQQKQKKQQLQAQKRKPSLLWDQKEDKSKSFLPTPKVRTGKRQQPKHVEMLQRTIIPHSGQSVRPDEQHHEEALAELGKLEAKMKMYRLRLEKLSQYPKHLDDIVGDEVIDGMKADMASDSDSDPTAEPIEPKDTSYVPVKERRRRRMALVRQRMEARRAIEKKKLHDIEKLHKKLQKRLRKRQQKDAESTTPSSTLHEATVNPSKQTQKRGDVKSDVLAQWANAAKHRVSKKRQLRRKRITPRRALNRAVKQALNPVNGFVDVPLKDELSNDLRRAPIQAAKSILAYQQRKYAVMGGVRKHKDKHNKKLEKMLRS